MSEEIWKPIPGYETYYEASNWGNIRSLRRTGPGGGFRKTPKLLTRRDLFGIVKVTLAKPNHRRQWGVGCLVLMTFVHARPVNQEVAHQNGNIWDNRLENLRWDTHRNNIADKERHGTTARGERQGSSKLTRTDVLVICKSSERQVDIARRFGIHQGTVSDIKRGKIWSWLTGARKE